MFFTLTVQLKIYSEFKYYNKINILLDSIENGFRNSVTLSNTEKRYRYIS